MHIKGLAMLLSNNGESNDPDDEGLSVSINQIISSANNEAQDNIGDVREIFWMARDNAWDELVSALQRIPAEMIQRAVEDSDYDMSTSILHVVAASTSHGCYKVPIEVVQTILDLAPELACKGNDFLQTPLHLAVHSMPDRTDIIKCLVEADPSTVNQVDEIQQRPIDILCRKIIMMEEYSKYSKENMLKTMKAWETVHILAQASISNVFDRIPDRQPIITACLMATDFPFALTERAMKRYKSQLLEPNSEGDLALHAIARMPPPLKADDDDEEDIDDQEGDFLDRVLSLCPESASRRNRHNRIPLVLAIQSGRRWNSGIARLLAVYPAGLHDLELPLKLYPNLIQRWWNDENTPQLQKAQTVFTILQARPDIFVSREQV